MEYPAVQGALALNAHDKVMEILRADPGKDYTSSELAVMIWPEIKDDPKARANRRNALNHTLQVAERFGMVIRTEHRSHYGTLYYSWRAAA